MSVLILMWERIRGGTEWGERESKSESEGRVQQNTENDKERERETESEKKESERESWQPLKNMRGFHSGFYP